MKRNMKQLVKQIVVVTVFVLLISIPKLHAYAKGKPFISITTNEMEVQPESLTGSFFYLISPGDDIVDPNQSSENYIDILKVTATINGTVYDVALSNGEHGDYVFKFTYPTLKLGTPIVINITDNAGVSDSVTVKMNYEFNYWFYIEEKDISPTQVIGTAEAENDKADDTGFSIIAKIGEETYEGTVTGHEFVIKYPEQAIDTKVKLILTDRCGKTVTDTYKIVNRPIKLQVDPIYYYSTKVTGKTVPNAKVWVWYDNGQIDGKSNSKGKFKIKIPEQKIGTEMTVGSKAKNGFENTEDVTVTDDSSAIYTSDDILVNTTNLKYYVAGGVKGDYFTVKIGGRTYKKVLTSSKDKYYTITIKRPNAGQEVTCKLYTKAGQRRASHYTYVYLAEDPKIGMTKNQVLKTAWGSPDKIDSYKSGSTTFEQWCYSSKYELKYLWFSKGILKSIHTYN